MCVRPRAISREPLHERGFEKQRRWRLRHNFETRESREAGTMRMTRGRSWRFQVIKNKSAPPELALPFRPAAAPGARGSH